MKIKLLKPVVVRGHPGVSVGEVIDCHHGLASYLVCDGLAEFVNCELEQIQTREPAIENRDPVIGTPREKRSRPHRAK